MKNTIIQWNCRGLRANYDELIAYLFTLRQFNACPLHQNLENFSVFRAKARCTIRESKRKSWKHYVSRLNSRTSMKKVWDMVAA